MGWARLQTMVRRTFRGVSLLSRPASILRTLVRVTWLPLARSLRLLGRGSMTRRRAALSSPVLILVRRCLSSIATSCVTVLALF